MALLEKYVCGVLLIVCLFGLQQLTVTDQDGRTLFHTRYTVQATLDEIKHLLHRDLYELARGRTENILGSDSPSPERYEPVSLPTKPLSQSEQQKSIWKYTSKTDPATNGGSARLFSQVARVSKLCSQGVRHLKKKTTDLIGFDLPFNWRTSSVLLAESVRRFLNRYRRVCLPDSDYNNLSKERTSVTQFWV